ncbi:ribosome biogenesis GTPase [Candidatus Photodesmus blepharus]|uniref:Ribosome biogenesis GTPase n=1 Tax=Candidatus Photodesmus blepharonis TaxID=1179155 RepID=A0A084CMC4_9GAMM|nr:ribosome biogenesis GTPase [Candidatus Photodesmus blepharus]
MIEKIARKRGASYIGGKVDLHEVSRILLHELHDGILGKITLDIPKMIKQESVKLEKTYPINL